MRGVNKIILIGNATRDAEQRYTTSGKAVSNIRLATNRQVSGQEVTQFHTIICWDKLAEIVGQYVTTGKQLYVEGRLEYRKYTNREGQEKEVAEIIASDVQFLGSKGESKLNVIGEKNGYQKGIVESETGEPTQPSSDEVNPDEIPF